MGKINGIVKNKKDIKCNKCKTVWPTVKAHIYKAKDLTQSDTVQLLCIKCNVVIYSYQT